MSPKDRKVRIQTIQDPTLKQCKYTQLNYSCLLYTISRIHISQTNLCQLPKGKKNLPETFSSVKHSCKGTQVSLRNGECHYAVFKERSWKTFLPLSLGSEGLDPSLNGTITVSPGTLGLSTYLGFLTGPAVGKT